MIFTKLFISLIFYGIATIGQPDAGLGKQDRYVVYLFLLEDCMITKAQTGYLDTLYRQYQCDSIQFQGYFPNKVSKPGAVADFVEKYQLPFPCTTEGAAKKAKRFGITITPEVVLYNETRDSVLYQGRINNLYERIGQRRSVVTSHELAAALYAVQRHKPVPIPRTNAVGCYLK